MLGLGFQGHFNTYLTILNIQFIGRGVTYFDDDDDEYGGDDVDGDVGDDGEEDDDVSAGCNSRGR